MKTTSNTGRAFYNNPFLAEPESATVRALPEISTLSLSPGDRAIGRLAKIELPEIPDGASQTDLAGDIFHEMFQSEPQSLPDVPEERGVNRALLDWMRETHGWQESRTATIANMPASMAASSLMWAHLQTDEALKEAMKQQETADHLSKQAKAMQAAADASHQAAEQSGDKSLGHQAQQFQNAANAFRQSAQEAAAAAQAAVAEATGKPLKQAAMMAATKDAAKEATQTAEAMAGWGMGPGSQIYSDPTMAQAFLRANTGKIARIARLAGRMRGFALQARKERVPIGVVPTEVDLTKDLTQVFPTELFLLHPDAPEFLRVQKTSEWLESGLLGYLPTGDGDERGPFVAAVDVSPSMRVGDREVVAKAVALGVAQVARQEGRPYILFAFGSDKRLMTAVSSSDDWTAHLKWAANSQNGGTDFDMSMGEVMRHLNAMGKGARGTDALFISDGEAGVAQFTRQAWQSFAQETGSRLLYVPVAKSYTDMEETADKVIHLADLDEAAGGELAAELGRVL